MVEGIRGGLVPRKWKQMASIGWAAWCQLRFLQRDNRLMKFHSNFRITAQLLSSSRDVENGRFGTQQYASFDWNDLWAIAPWMQEVITKKLNGAGLGNWGNWVYCNNNSFENCMTLWKHTRTRLSEFVCPFPFTHISKIGRNYMAGISFRCCLLIFHAKMAEFFSFDLLIRRIKKKYSFFFRREAWREHLVELVQ